LFDFGFRIFGLSGSKFRPVAIRIPLSFDVFVTIQEDVGG
jgi:hypothetical protein